jgi:hypothetical protein
LAIDPDDAPAHASLSYIASSENDLADAAQHLHRALELDRADMYVLRDSALLLVTLGRIDEAVRVNDALVRRDPVNPITLFNLGQLQLVAGRLDAAIASFRIVLSLAPGMANGHSQLGYALLMKDDAVSALAELEAEPSEIHKMLYLPMAYYALGRKADSDAALAALIAKYEKDAAYNIAGIHAFRHEADPAFAWLDKAIEYDDPGISEIVTDPSFEGIHADPRWLPFLRKIGYAPEQLAKIEFNVTLTEDHVAPKSASLSSGTVFATTIESLSLIDRVDGGVRRFARTRLRCNSREQGIRGVLLSYLVGSFSTEDADDRA